MKKYYNADELLKLNCDINIIDGARGIGKSTDICRRGIQERIATAGQRGGIAYIRRKDKQITKATIESYIKEDMLKKWTGGKWETIKCKGKVGYLARVVEIDENGKAIYEYSTYPVIFGFSVSNADDYKSLNYNLDYAIYEEYQTNDYYLDDEPALIM